MRPIYFLFIAAVTLLSCKKTHSPKREPRVISDTLLFYSQMAPSGKPSIVFKSFKSGETKTLFFDGDHPFATNLRVVYIKSGTTLGYAKVDGVAKLLIPLTQPSSPSLSLDSRLFCVVDKLPDKYQLLKYDTTGNKVTLFESVDQIATPAFSSDGQKIVFTQKTSANSSNIFIIPITGGTPKRVTPLALGSFDEYPTITNETVYFTRSRYIDSTLSSEIFSSNFGGTSITQLTNFTNNWTTPSFFIKNLRKVSNGVVDSSSLICVSNYNSTNSDIYLYTIGGGTTLKRMSETAQGESYPSLIPNFAK